MIDTLRMRPITKRAIDAMKPGDELWDAEVKGFYVRCRQSARVYIYKARIAGRQRYITIGRHGSPWTVDEARKEAKRLQGEIAEGKDPATQREKIRATLTVTDIAGRFLSEHCGITSALYDKFAAKAGAPVRPGTARGYRDTLRDHILPALGKYRADAVTSADLAKLHHDMRDTPRAANYVLSVMSKMTNWASARHLWTIANPTMGIERYNENRRTKALTIDETQRLVEAIANAEQDGRITLYSAAALRFLLLCGLRPAEALKLKWTDIDFTTGRIHLPETKTGPRDAILSAHAITLLDSIPQLHGNPYVFCGQKPCRPLASLQHAFETVWAEAKMPAEVVLYTLRHNFGSTLADNRVEAYELMKMMGHKNLSTSLRYIHLREAGVKATSTRATDAIAATLAAASNRASAEPRK